MLSRIRLELARTKEHPDGDARTGYEFVAPLDDKGFIDPAQWHEARSKCQVLRFRPNESSELGHLARRRGGSWAFHYDFAGAAEDDETGYRFAAHSFRQGEYVSIREDGELMTYRIASIVPFG